MMVTGAFADGQKGSEDDQQGVLTIRLHDISLRALVVVFHYFYSNTLPLTLTTFLTPFGRFHKNNDDVFGKMNEVGVVEEEVEEEGVEEEEKEFGVLVEVLACANMLGVEAVVNECQGRLCDTLHENLSDYVLIDDGKDEMGGRENVTEMTVADDRQEIVITSPSPSPLDTEIETVLTTLSLALLYDCKILAFRCRVLLRR